MMPSVASGAQMDLSVESHETTLAKLAIADDVYYGRLETLMVELARMYRALPAD
jgi:hypothetical protein